MSRQKNVHATSHGERSEQLALKSALEIVQRFNDPQIPLCTNDFRKMIFRALMDTHFNKLGTIQGADQIDAMYYLWEILDDIDAFNYLFKDELSDLT